MPRAIGNVVVVLVAGAPVLAALRRCAGWAAFGALPQFEGRIQARPRPDPSATGE